MSNNNFTFFSLGVLRLVALGVMIVFMGVNNNLYAQTTLQIPVADCQSATLVDSLQKQPPLNSLNIGNLILISQYILGLKSLSNYQLLAADANASGTITAFDIAELRKLILGTYQTLPKKHTGYFFDKKLHNQASENAFSFPLLGDSISYSHSLPDSMSIKYPEDRDQTPWAMATPAHRGQKGSVITIPVVSNRSGNIQGWQMDLNFDPNVLAVEEVEWPAHSMPQPEHRGWNLNAEGNIRLIWWDAVAPLSVTTGVPVCQIKVRLLRDIAAESPLLQPNRSEGIPNLVFDQTGKEFGLQWENIPADLVKSAPVNTPRLEVAVYPNPTQRHYRVNIQSPTEQTGTITILDLNGKPLSEKTITLNTGINTITSAQWPVPLAPGTYTIQVQTDNDRQQIRFVRL